MVEVIKYTGENTNLGIKSAILAIMILIILIPLVLLILLVLFWFAFMLALLFVPIAVGVDIINLLKYIIGK